jgi:hypothetical protein
MIRIETREHVKYIVNEYTDGISLSALHGKMHRKITRLQLRTLLGKLYAKKEISRERVIALNRRETKYFPFNGSEPVTRKKKAVVENNNKMLSMKDFMAGKKYQAYIEL